MDGRRGVAEGPLLSRCYSCSVSTQGKCEAVPRERNVVTANVMPRMHLSAPKFLPFHRKKYDTPPGNSKHCSVTDKDGNTQVARSRAIQVMRSTIHRIQSDTVSALTNNGIT